MSQVVLTREDEGNVARRAAEPQRRARGRFRERVDAAVAVD
jgi:hypothetical protein